MNCWYYIEEKLNNTIKCIFKDYDVDSLSLYEKRRVIFEYLCNNLAYDYELLDKIRDFKINKTPVQRDSFLELMSVVDDRIGICNAISQYYKLLLEKVDIKAYCVICDDGTEVGHQLNLVYDSDNDVYSFDDITSVIVGRGTKDMFYDYDLVFANSMNQGNKAIMLGQKYVILPEEWINRIVRREKSLCKTLHELPDNIDSMKEIQKGKKSKI